MLRSNSVDVDRAAKLYEPDGFVSVPSLPAPPKSSISGLLKLLWMFRLTNSSEISAIAQSISFASIIFAAFSISDMFQFVGLFSTSMSSVTQAIVGLECTRAGFAVTSCLFAVGSNVAQGFLDADVPNSREFANEQARRLVRVSYWLFCWALFAALAEVILLLVFTAGMYALIILLVPFVTIVSLLVATFA
eukprot:TRINITY_DN13341_c0_g1_i1.p1 TRINITY_DN13341_c0_g1~~TRINITY_DN13341_c0_g1_i1.p1  ORF type:complete len:191 (-),score=30.21 TRINITY_DN13341_c0_g1_i1:246-818(-)